MESVSIRQRAGHPAALAMLVLLISQSFALLNAGLVFPVQAHEETEASWLVSQHEFADITLAANTTNVQWADANMLTIEQGDETEISLMSVHNNTYVVILVQRELNTSLAEAGVVLSFNDSAVIWAWVGGQLSLLHDHHVRSAATLTSGILTVVFGRPLAAEGSEIGFKDETPYSELVKVLTWDNGADLGSANLEDAASFGLELLPYINPYPTLPLVYSGAILAGGIGFVILELRKHREGVAH